MTRNRFIVALFVLCFLAAAVRPVYALNLVFKVEKSTSDLYINSDGSATVEYTYVFVNDQSGDPIDAIDIGVPTNSFSLNQVKAEINSTPITDIENSPYVKPGIALNLHAKQIMPGARGTVHIIINNVRGMLFKTDKVDKATEPYASFQFSPNTFGSEFLRGSTDATITLHLPPGMVETEPRWYTPQKWGGDTTPTASIDDQGRVVYSWKYAQADSFSQYIFGGAFPSRLVPTSALLVESPIKSSSGSSTILELLCPWVMCLGFFGFIGVSLFGSVSAAKKRRLQYFPPKIAIEGNGIKRGLTAVEAAILLEQPLDKILSMILFSVVKKGAAQVIAKDPLKITRLETAKVELYDYETAFIHAMLAAEPAETRKGLQKIIVDLVRGISEKMRGFSRRETVAYYQDIMNKAWAQVQAAGTPEVKMKKFDEVMEWTMLDKRFGDRSQEFFGRGPVFAPIWWNRYDPTFGRSTFSTPNIPNQVGSAPSGMSMPTLPGADFAASVTGGLQSFSSNILGDITNFTSNVTKTTNPEPVAPPSSRSGGSGGGRSCACACACAGCACACAGGGR
jgi:hypothetical protein